MAPKTVPFSSAAFPLQKKRSFAKTGSGQTSKERQQLNSKRNAFPPFSRAGWKVVIPPPLAAALWDGFLGPAIAHTPVAATAPASAPDAANAGAAAAATAAAAAAAAAAAEKAQEEEARKRTYLFCDAMPLYTKTDHFTKTGSGQTVEKSTPNKQDRLRFCRR
eukprot:COSAG06_NODE_708_length_12893_cov_10.008676_16_plen_163_part_00